MRRNFPGKRKTLALAILLAGTSLPVLAQQQQDEVEEIIVTGSLIRGTPVDAALPVEVFTRQDLEETGNPTALDFVKGLTSSGPTTGEGYYFSGSGLTGQVNANLRGIGSDKTLTLFNGRRASENTSVIPSIAIGRIEVLKDGAAVTYGADATGGVINYLTRDSFDGFEITSSYKQFEGSDGDWNMAALAGFDFGATNFMFAAEWDHRSETDSIERGFTSQPYSVNPAPWSTLTNLAGWIPRGTLPATPGNTANSEWGSPTNGAFNPVSDYTQSSCEAVGGTFVGSFTCAYNYIPYYNVVEENEVYRLFGQMTTEVSDNMDFFLRASFSRVFTPNAYGSPSQPVIRGPARATGATYQIYVPKTNPFVSEFATRTGFATNPAFAATQGFTPVTYRAFAHGGNDTFASGGSHSTPNKNDYRNWHVSSGVTGDFEIAVLNEVFYDFALTYNMFDSYQRSPDIIGNRLQQAVNGFGGPNCNAPDLDPVRYGTQNPAAAGKNGCQWYNPFASNFASQPVLGLANPSYSAALANPQEMREWLFNERASSSTFYDVTVDLVFSGSTGIELPGGEIGWGAGTQWRTSRFDETVTDPQYNGANVCMWPGQVPRPTTDPLFDGCTPDNPGPFFFFGINPPDSTKQDQLSFFGELSLPVLDNLYLNAAVRNESFTGDLDATVTKFSGKWDVTDNLALRGSYGDNYQAPGAGIVPGNVNNGVNSYTIAAGNWRGAQTVVNGGIEPETATVWSTGVIWQSRGFSDDHNFQVILDYFDIETVDELALLANVNQIANAVFTIPPPGSTTVPNSGLALANCSHAMIPRITFNGGACVQGVTNANDFSNITTEFGNGPGQHTAGYDLGATYDFPALEGQFRLGLSVTKVEIFEFTPTVLDGVTIQGTDDRLGTLNFATIANAAPEWRANANVNYARGDHNLRFVVNYTSGVDDERFILPNGTVNVAALVPAGFQPGTTTRFAPSYYGVFGDDWVSYDLHYMWDLPWATLSASVVNMADEDPPESRQEMGYDPRIGSPLGRQFEIGLRKSF